MTDFQIYQSMNVFVWITIALNLVQTDWFEVPLLYLSRRERCQSIDTVLIQHVDIYIRRFAWSVWKKEALALENLESSHLCICQD